MSKVKLLPKQKFSLTAVNSAGSGANVQALSAGTADFAILQGLFGSYAVTGTGPVSEPQENLRSVTMLWQNVEQFVMAADKAAMDTGRNLWVPYTISAGTYPGQDKDVNTIAQPNFLAVNASVDEEHVYLLTKTMYENLPFLQAIHPATKAMAVEVVMAGLRAPLHPGAARYYTEVGLDIPANLIAN